MAGVVNQEIALAWDDLEFETNLFLENGDLGYEQGLVTAVLISIFTDARADDSDELPDILNPDKRGWWGDIGAPRLKDDKIGSKLWLLERSKTVSEIIIRAKQYLEESLQWFIDDGVASSVMVITERQTKNYTDYLVFKTIIYLLQETLSGSEIVMTMTFRTGSSGADDRFVEPLSFDGMELTFDGVDVLIF